MTKAESKYFNTALRFDKALLALLEKKPFEFITIRELCETAEVNRSTFYLHYENTKDLLQETTEYVMENFLSYFSAGSDQMPARYMTCDLQELVFINEQYLHPYLSFVKDNQKLFTAVMSNPIAFDTEKIFQRKMDSIFRPILDRFHYPRDEQNYVMRFYLNGIAAIVMEWVKEDCRKSVSEISEIIRYCIFNREP